MKSNIGTTDSIIRLIAGLAIAGLGIYYHSWWGILAILPLVTAGIRWCPVYLPFGISTKCKCDDPNCKCHDESSKSHDEKKEEKV